MGTTGTLQLARYKHQIRCSECGRDHEYCTSSKEMKKKFLLCDICYNRRHKSYKRKTIPKAVKARSGAEWTTNDEIDFIRDLIDNKHPFYLDQYIKSLTLRRSWGKVNDKQIFEYLEIVTK